MKSDEVVFGLLVAVILLAFGATQPYMEMRSFNKFSKTKATYLDALFTRLVVVADK